LAFFSINELDLQACSDSKATLENMVKVKVKLKVKVK
jgi:hypothetical protein